MLLNCTYGRILSTTVNTKGFCPMTRLHEWTQIGPLNWMRKFYFLIKFLVYFVMSSISSDFPKAKWTSSETFLLLVWQAQKLSVEIIFFTTFVAYLSGWDLLCHILSQCNKENESYIEPFTLLFSESNAPKERRNANHFTTNYSCILHTTGQFV